MENSVLELQRNVKMLLKFLKEKHPETVKSEPLIYSHKVDRPKSGDFYETTTPKAELSALVYCCIGRLKFYGSDELFVYLEVEEMQFDETIHMSSAFLWPVKCTWSVDLIDEDDPICKQKTICLGGDSFIFNKPRQGGRSHPNDWISVDLKKISNLYSMTVRWTVSIEPLFNGLSMNELKTLLEKLEMNCIQYTGPKTSYRKLKEKIDKMLIKENETREEISRLKCDISKTNEGLNSIQEGFKDFNLNLQDISQVVINALININKDCVSTDV